MQTKAGIKREQGTGLGLPISKRIVELHGGKLNINSKLNKGTEITINLPSKRVKEKIDSEKISKKEQKQNNKTNYEFPNKKILIVDDNYANNLVLEKIIKKEKITDKIIPIGDANKILNAIKKTNPDLIILDQNLSSAITGAQISKTLKTNKKYKKYKKVPVIMLTADTFAEDIKKIMKESKAEAYLEKPMNFKKLRKTIVSLLNKKS